MDHLACSITLMDIETTGSSQNDKMLDGSSLGLNSKLIKYTFQLSYLIVK